MSHSKIFSEMEKEKLKDLKLQLSPVQQKVYKTSTKSQIITQIRLNIIVGFELSALGREAQNE